MAKRKKKSKDFKVYSGLVPTARNGFGMGSKRSDRSGKRRRKRKK